MITFLHSILSFFFFFNDTATTEIYTLSLHDALPISQNYISDLGVGPAALIFNPSIILVGLKMRDRKSTRLNSSHSQISYAVFCLKKKKKKIECICNNDNCINSNRHTRVEHATE